MLYPRLRVQGYTVLKGALRPAEVAALKADAKGVENNGPSSQQSLGNSEGGVLHWNQAYRDVMAHPLVVRAQLPGSLLSVRYGNNSLG